MATIVALAALLRIVGLPQAPPGLNQDEAANAWNAWCLLKTGRDQAGSRWPIFYARALGENRSTLFLYTLLPFQALGGLNVWTTRLPAAVGGVATVLLLYWITARLFDRPTGLVAAALLALSPWHLQLTRLGYEAGLGPLLACLPLAALLWAGFPLSRRGTRPVLWRSLLAGLLVGVCCYGYAAVRLFVPVFLTGCVLSTAPAWWRLVRERHGAAAFGALLLGVALTFGPLAYQHLADPAQIGRRAEHIWLWDEDDPLKVRLTKVVDRYVGHFGPDFLFREGDHFEMQSARGFGSFQWYALPLMIVGLVVTWRSLRELPAARVLACWLIVYPLGDCFNRHWLAAADGTVFSSLHALRSAPGLCGPVLLAAVGAVTAGRALWQWRRAAALGVIAAFALVAVAMGARFQWYLFGEHNRREAVRRHFHVDLVEACAWIRPRVAHADAVFITSSNMNMPYIVTLVALGCEPREWFEGPREYHTVGNWDFYYRVGKYHFLSDQVILARLQDLARNGRRNGVIFLLRPGASWPAEPAHTIRGADGRPALLIYTRVL